MMNLDIAALPIIDTHEHLADESHRVHVEKDVLSLFLRHYIPTDLANAGLSIERIQAIRDPGVKIEQRWSELEPFWKRVSHTAYAQALKIAVRDLYQMDQINLDTIGEIAARVEEASKPGLYSHVFQKAGIQFAIVNDLDESTIPTRCMILPSPGHPTHPAYLRKSSTAVR
jgi:hypothetical protein